MSTIQISQVGKSFRWIGYASAAAVMSGLVALPGTAAPQNLADSMMTDQPTEAIAPHQSLMVAQSQDIVDTAITHGSLSTMIGLLEELGMAEDLRGYGRFTVFAPTDNAFRAIPANVFQALVSDRELMARVLAYHVIASTEPIEADEVTSAASYRSLERSELELRPRGGNVYVNGVRVIEEDIEASNGVIHVIDQVLIPDDVLSEIR
ncbi:MAG: fasciclin domain-containing protein [Elainellaceae cyanobacterium]